MKAVILAAGKGERLGNITKEIPKPMIKIAGKPVLEHNILLCSTHGISDIFINLHHLPHVIKDYFGDGSNWNVNIHYKYEPEILGTAGGVKNFQEELYNEPFFVIYGDNFINFNMTELVTFHKIKNSDFTIALFWLDDVSQSGVADLSPDDRIIKFIEKPKNNYNISHWVNAGVYVINPVILNEYQEGFSDFGKDIIPMLINRGFHIYGMKIDDKVIAIDTPELLSNALKEKGN